MFVNNLQMLSIMFLFDYGWLLCTFIISLFFNMKHIEII